MMFACNQLLAVRHRDQASDENAVPRDPGVGREGDLAAAFQAPQESPLR